VTDYVQYVGSCISCCRPRNTDMTPYWLPVCQFYGTTCMQRHHGTEELPRGCPAVVRTFVLTGRILNAKRSVFRGWLATHLQYRNIITLLFL
jgi:hypothetical protein